MGENRERGRMEKGRMSQERKGSAEREKSPTRPVRAGTAGGPRRDSVGGFCRLSPPNQETVGSWDTRRARTLFPHIPLVSTPVLLQPAIPLLPLQIEFS